MIHFFSFLLTFCIFAHGAVAAVSVEPVCTRSDFPNYFRELQDPNEAKRLIDESLSAILTRLEVPYVEDGHLQYQGFFGKIQKIVTAKVLGAKAYISGGMVRSLLGYVYKKLHNMMLDAHASTTTRKIDQKLVIEEVFYDIIHGKRRTDALFSEFAEDEEGGKKVSPKGEKLPNLGTRTKFTSKELIPLQVLGIGSDYDILIDFPEGTSDSVKNSTIEAVKEFINSFRTYLRIVMRNHDAFERTVAPMADVGEYQKQTDESVSQGGSEIDWLAFPVSGGAMKLPIKHTEIMDNFISGSLHYLPPGTKKPHDPAKQTIRGLRALLEIPFLSFDVNSLIQIKTELEKLIEQGSLSSSAQEQIEKMIRNARLGAAGNRFFGNECDGQLGSLLQKLAIKLGKKTFIPEFVEQKRSRSYDVALMPFTDFIKKHTDNGILYHGTPNMANVLSMIRNGFVVSSATQGAAAYGRGVYTTKDYLTAKGYIKGTGIVLPLTVHEGVHVVDMGIPEHKKHYQDWLKIKAISETKFGESFKDYAKEFGIDIIVNEHVLIQNARSVSMPKNIKAIVKAAQDAVITRLDKGEEVSFEELVEMFHPKQSYGKLGQIYGLNQFDFKNYLETQQKKLVERLNNGEKVHIRDIIDMFHPEGKYGKIAAEYGIKNFDLKDYLETQQSKMIERIDKGEDVHIQEIIDMFHPQGRYGKIATEYEIKNDYLESYVKSKTDDPQTLLYLYERHIQVGDFDVKENLKKCLLKLFSSVGLKETNVHEFIQCLSFGDDIRVALKFYLDFFLQDDFQNMFDFGDYSSLDSKMVFMRFYNRDPKEISKFMSLFKNKVIENQITDLDLRYLDEIMLTDEQVVFLTKLVKEGGLDQLSFVDLINIPVYLNSSLADTLILLFKKSIIEKLTLYNLKDIPEILSITQEQINFLQNLVQRGVIERPSVRELNILDVHLTPDQISALELMIKEKIIPIRLLRDLKEVPSYFSEHHANNLINLSKAGVLEKHFYSLRRVPQVLSIQEEQINDLKTLIDTGVIYPISINGLDSFPSYFSQQHRDVLIKMHEAGILGKINNFNKLPKDLSGMTEDKINFLKKLIELGIFGKFDDYTLNYAFQEFMLSEEKIKLLVQLRSKGVIDVLDWSIQKLPTFLTQDYVNRLIVLFEQGVMDRLWNFNNLPEHLQITDAQILVLKNLIDLKIMYKISDLRSNFLAYNLSDEQINILQKMIENKFIDTLFTHSFIPPYLNKFHLQSLIALKEAGLLRRVIDLKNLPRSFNVTDDDITWLKTFSQNFDFSYIPVLLELKRLGIPVKEFINENGYFKPIVGQFSNYPIPIESGSLTIEMFESVKELDRLIFVPDDQNMTLEEYVRSVALKAKTDQEKHHQVKSF